MASGPAHSVHAAAAAAAGYQPEDCIVDLAAHRARRESAGFIFIADLPDRNGYFNDEHLCLFARPEAKHGGV